MSDRSARGWIVGIAAILVATAVVAALVVWRTTGSGDDTQQVMLEALDDAGPDPFTESVSIAETAQLASFGEEQRQDEPDQIANGADAGLYGGSRSAVCDRAKLTSALTSDPGRAQAWALAQGIAPDDIERFLTSLTPAVLSYDTLVTNHGIRNGQAHPFQAVLQAGTTVFVDAYGVPRVRCACGNPLLSPTTDVTAISVSGTRWQDFQTTTVRYVQPAPAPQTTLPFVDIETREPLPTPVGGDGEGFGEYLVITDTGVDVADASGQTRSVLDEPVTEAFDDGRGGVIFTPYWPRSGPPTAKQSSIYWLKAGATEPEPLLESDDSNREQFTLAGAFVNATGTWVLYGHLILSEPMSDSGTTTVIARNLDTDEEHELDAMVLPSEITSASMNDEGLLYLELNQGCSTPHMFDARWQPVVLPWAQTNCLAAPCGSIDGIGCGSATALDDDGNLVALITDQQSDPIEVQLLDPTDGALLRRFPVSRPNGWTIDVTGDDAIISDSGLDSSTPPGRAVLLNLQTGETRQLPVSGKVRHLKAPLVLPSQADGSTSGGAITSDWLRNATLPDAACESVRSGPGYDGGPAPGDQLRNGELPGFPEAFGGVSIIEENGTATGDLDGDGIGDGAIALMCWPGGTFHTTDLVVYLAAVPDRPVLVSDGVPPPAAESKGVKPSGIVAIAIDNGRLTATWSVPQSETPGVPRADVHTTWTVNEGGATLLDG